MFSPHEMVRVDGPGLLERGDGSILIGVMPSTFPFLPRQGDEGKVLEEAVFDRLWEETTARIRALKVRERDTGGSIRLVGELVGC